MRKKKKARRQLAHDGTLAENLIASHQGAELDKIMFDPGEQHLDLNKSEKIRTTALLMAINYVRETIVNDAEMYRALRQDGKELVPATVPWVIQCSVEFEDFISGYYSRTNVAMVKRGMELEQKRAAKESGRSTPDQAPSQQQVSESTSEQRSESPQSVDAVDPDAEKSTD